MLTGFALASWAAVIALGHYWGTTLMQQGRKIVLFTPPLLGGYRPAVPSGLWVPLAVAAISVAVLPSLVRRLRWRMLLLVAPVASLAWWFALATVDGPDAFTGGLDWDLQFATIVGRAGSEPFGFLRGFVDGMGGYSVQVKGHPPGLPLLFGLMDRVGMRGAAWAAAVVIGVGVTAVPAVLVGTREVAGESTARAVAPFIVLAPIALWMVTSIDALFVGITAWMVTLVILAINREGRRADALAVAAGLLAAVAALLSYGLVLVAVVPLLVAFPRRRWRPILVTGGVAAASVLALAPLGFWWFSGLLATRHEYYTLDVDRPFSYFFVNNLSAWALALGPATVVAFAVLRDRRVWLLAGGGVGAALLANLSGLSEGEVERIWLPFTVWALTAVAVLGGRRWSTRVWLAAQAGSAIAVTAVVGTLW